ncbi:Fanconi-associated nuclease 1 [Lamellibrachia satsuma]|nr:Fanconi-associated nuclease 1 [Lamellibrachia satsuma]
MFKKQWRTVEKTPVEQTTESDITINLVDDKECSTGITVETDTCSNASKRGVSSTGKLSQSRARRSSRLSLKRRSTPETEKDPGEPSSAGNKIQHHSYVADGARVKKKIQKVADGYTSNLETRKGTQRPVLSQASSSMRRIGGKSKHLKNFQKWLRSCIFGSSSERQYRWIRYAKIVYPKIADDLTETLRDLAKSKILLDEENLTDLSEILHTLPAPSLKNLALTFRLSNPVQPRSQLIDSIMKHGRQKNIGSFFMGSLGGTADTIMKRAHVLLGPCYKLEETTRAVFMRVLMLFALHRTRGDEDDSSSAQQQLFQMLMSNIGKIKYPEYEISRKSRIFPNRESLLRFSLALQCETDIRDALEKKAFDRAMLTYTTARETALELHNNDAIVKHDESLPEHLRVYTAGSVWVRVLTLGVELLQFVKDYTAATHQLKALLAQTVYHPDYRGRWYDRLTLNLDHHLKERHKALDMIGQALADPRVRAGHRYSVFVRAQRLCRSYKTLKKRWTEFEDDKFCEVMEATKVTIMARQPVHSVPGTGPLYISQQPDASGNVTYLKRVEDIALQHYSSTGFPCGIHGESSTFIFFLGLLFWDIIFSQDEIDVFYNHYQTYPLDLFSDHFYTSRRTAIDDRLTTIRESSQQELSAMLERSWEAHKDTSCFGLSWDRFTALEEAQGLLECLGGRVVAGILERLIRDLRHTTGGMPDLVVWNTRTKKVKLVEVKGPGDRLSTKQILWLDYLHRLPVDAEVCHVQGVGTKKLQTSGEHVAKVQAE